MIALVIPAMLLAATPVAMAPAVGTSGATKPHPRAATRVAAANRAATERPSSHFFVNAVQVYPWRDGAIYEALVAPGAVTDIALQAGETLIAVAAGDTARWVVGDTMSGAGDTRRTHVLVKPYSAGLATNLVITTDRRAYYLKLTATAGTAMAALSWTYPTDSLIALTPRTPAGAPQPASPIGPDIERLNFGYAISGAKAAWRPLRAFDDGRQTYLEFPSTIATGEAPPLFVVGADGAAELVNYRMRGRFYIVDRIFDAAELRLGTKRAQVVRIDRTGVSPASTGGRS